MRERTWQPRQPRRLGPALGRVASGDVEAEHQIYDENVVCEYPQSGETIHGRRNLQAMRGHHPERPSGFRIRRIVGTGDLWVTEYAINYATTVSRRSASWSSRTGGSSANPVLRPAVRLARVAQWVEGRVHGTQWITTTRL